MRLSREISRRDTSGFTLVEIAVAIAILGVGLATLMTLLTSVMDSYARERNMFKASLYAQYLMTMVEVVQADPDLGSSETDLAGALKEAGYFDDLENGDTEAQLHDWKLSRSVVAVDVPLLPDTLRRVDLIIRWGEAASDSYRLVFFSKVAVPAKRTEGGA